MSARENILGRVRAALGRSESLTDAQSKTMRGKLRDHPRGPLPAMQWEPVARFKERCVMLSSTVDEVPTLADVPAGVRRYLEEKQLPPEAVCWPELISLPWSQAGLSADGRPVTGDDKVGVTGVFCAIAETGTLMLLSGEHTHAATSLVPETHIAIVPKARVVRSMEDGWDLLRSERRDLPRQVAFVSGPSRTADIEMTLVLGIHGPYRVHVILVGS